MKWGEINRTNIVKMLSLDSNTTLRLGTRGSLLARMQSQLIADELEKHHPGLRVELHLFKTAGDQIADRPLHELGGKGLFTREIEQAILDGAIDLAVHSFKDVPVTMPLVDQTGLVVAAVPQRADPRDVMISRKASRLVDLAGGARIGTGSLRRRCQIHVLRPDLIVEPIRGNIDTRLRKLRDGEFDAIILAKAGLERARLFDESEMNFLDFDEMLPAPGQGALAIQCRREDARTRSLLSVLNDEKTVLCVQAERSLVAVLEGDCYSPIAALATTREDQIFLRAVVGGRGGSAPVLCADAQARYSEPQMAVDAVFKSLSGQGVQALLQGKP